MHYDPMAITYRVKEKFLLLLRYKVSKREKRNLKDVFRRVSVVLFYGMMSMLSKVYAKHLFFKNMVCKLKRSGVLVFSKL